MIRSVDTWSVLGNFRFCSRKLDTWLAATVQTYTSVETSSYWVVEESASSNSIMYQKKLNKRRIFRNFHHLSHLLLSEFVSFLTSRICSFVFSIYVKIGQYSRFRSQHCGSTTEIPILIERTGNA